MLIVNSELQTPLGLLIHRHPPLWLVPLVVLMLLGDSSPSPAPSVSEALNSGPIPMDPACPAALRCRPSQGSPVNAMAELSFPFPAGWEWEKLIAKYQASTHLPQFLLLHRRIQSGRQGFPISEG